MYLNDPEQFDQTAREWTEIYAVTSKDDAYSIEKTEEINENQNQQSSIENSKEDAEKEEEEKN